MATKKSSRFGVVVTRNGGGLTTYRGTQAALIAAGVCSEDRFPAGLKRLTYFTDKKDRFTQLWRRRGGVFELMRPEPRPPRASDSYASVCAAIHAGHAPPPIPDTPESDLRCELARELGDLRAITISDTGELLRLAPESYEAIRDAIQDLREAIRNALVEPLPRKPAEVRPFLRVVRGRRSEG